MPCKVLAGSSKCRYHACGSHVTSVRQPEVAAPTSTCQEEWLPRTVVLATCSRHPPWPLWQRPPRCMHSTGIRWVNHVRVVGAPTCRPLLTVAGAESTRRPRHAAYRCGTRCADNGIPVHDARTRCTRLCATTTPATVPARLLRRAIRTRIANSEASPPC